MSDPVSMFAAIGQNGMNAAAQWFMNKENRLWVEKMQERQRQWAKEDWNTQNAYDSPAQQMQRLKEAGINPRLAFAKGTVDNTGGVIRSTDTPQYEGKAPQAEGIVQAMNQGAQIDMQKRLTDAQVANINAQTLKNLAEAEKTGLKNEFTRETWQLVIDTMQTGKTKLGYEGMILGKDLEVRESMNLAKLEEIVASVDLKVQEREQKDIMFEISKAKSEHEVLLIKAKAVIAQLEQKTQQYIYDTGGNAVKRSTLDAIEQRMWSSINQLNKGSYPSEEETEFIDYVFKALGFAVTKRP